MEPKEEDDDSEDEEEGMSLDDTEGDMRSEPIVAVTPFKKKCNVNICTSKL